VDAKRLVRARARQGGGKAVLVVGRDLKLEGCGPVFGYADRRRGVAVVSTFRLAGDAAKLGERVEKVIAHETGHLEGRGHCNDERCAMHQAGSVAELDARGLAMCERCSRGRRGIGWQLMAAAAACLALFLGLDASVRALTKRTPPFTARELAAGPAVAYKGETVLRLPDGDSARRAAAALNGAYMQLEPARLEVRASGGVARVLSAGVLVAEIDARTAGGADPAAYGRAWAARMDALLQGKGARGEGCPNCHVERRAEVEEAARRRARAWR
jgi:hypothetical protein